MAEASAVINISQPAPLQKKGELVENWNTWKQNFKIYLIASGIPETDRTACALFLHTIGQYGRDIYNELELGDIEDITLEELYKKFDQHFNPQRNLVFSRYQFFNTKQGKSTFDDFLGSLKQKSKSCEFGDLSNSLVMTQIIAGISNKKLQQRLFTLNDLDLEKIIQECLDTELAESYVQQIPKETYQKKKFQKNVTTKEKTSNESKTKPQRAAPQNKQPKQDSRAQSGNNQWTFVTEDPKHIRSCKMCGGTHAHGSCPAYGTLCTLCMKPNHFANVCKTTEQLYYEYSPKQISSCKMCGGTHAYGSCPAYGKVCTLCKKPNHFAKVCETTEQCCIS